MNDALTNWPRLAVPARSITGAGCRQHTALLLAGLGVAEGATVVVVHSRSARWAADLARDLRALGLLPVMWPAGGEPSLPDLEQAIAALRPKSPGAVVAIGGGSALDMGKALAALLCSDSPVRDHLEIVGKGRPLDHAPLPFVAIPTTAGTGAEATKNAVIDIPEARRKVSLRDARMIPAVAVLDPELTYGLPRQLSLSTGMDALTQLIEPFLSHKATAATDALTAAAILPTMRALIRLSQGEDAGARATMLNAAHLSGIALANAGLGAVHGFAGVIGGQTGRPHGAICAALLPEVLRVNRLACARAGQAMGKFAALDGMISEAFGSRLRPAEQLLAGFNAAQALAGLGLEKASDFDVPAVVEMAKSASSMKANPVALSSQELTEILENCL